MVLGYSIQKHVVLNRAEQGAPLCPDKSGLPPSLRYGGQVGGQEGTRRTETHGACPTMSASSADAVGTKEHGEWKMENGKGRSGKLRARKQQAESEE